MPTLLKAVLIGLGTGILIAIPIGPSGLESVRWTITKGFRRGIWVAVGSVIADTFDVLLINFGLLSWIQTNKLLEAIFWLLSGTITFYIGYRTLKKNKKQGPQEDDTEGKVIKDHPVFTGFIINTTYPMTHFSWLAFSTTFIALWRGAGRIPYVTFLASLLTGIFICLFTLNFLVSKGKKVVKEKHSDKLGSFLAYAIAGLGVAFFVFGIYRLWTTVSLMSRSVSVISLTGLGGII
jgi:threonine/homoserine/homoserine lactone efflux protein